MAVSLDVLVPTADDAASGGAAIVVPDDADLHWNTAAELARTLLDWLADGYATATVIRPPSEAPGIHLPTQRSAPAV